MAVGLKGGTTLGTLEDKEYFVRKMLQRAHAVQVWNQWGNKEFIPSRGGTSIEWRQMPRLATTTTALTEGTFGSETPPTIARVTATVNQYGIFFRSTDVVDAQAIDDLRAEGANALGQAAGESFDLLTRAVVIAGTTVQYAGVAASRGALTSGMRLTSAELREAKTTLSKNAAPKFPDGTYKAIIEPDQEYDLWSDANIVNAAQYAANRGGDNPLFTGKLANYWASTSSRRTSCTPPRATPPSDSPGQTCTSPWCSGTTSTGRSSCPRSGSRRFTTRSVRVVRLATP